MGAVKRGGVGKNCNFRQIACLVLDTIQASAADTGEINMKSYVLFTTVPFLMSMSDRERSFQHPETLQGNYLENVEYIAY